MKVLDQYEKIKSLLQDPKVGATYQDDYYQLLTRIWWDEIGRDKTMTAREFLQRLRRKEYSHPESLMRARRKVQEENPALRGKTYANRKNKEQAEVKKELGYK